MESELRRVVDALPGLIWTALADGQIDFLNQRWSEYTGLGLGESAGRGWQAAVHPEDLPSLLAGWRGVPAPGGPIEAEARLRRADHNYRWFSFRAHPAAEASGQVAKWCGLSTDIHDRMLAEEALRASERRAGALLAGEKQLLEMVASGRPASDILEALCGFVESMVSGCYCSIVLVDPSGTKLQEAIAPSLAVDFNEAVRGWPLDRIGGPCVMAARDKTQVIMSDVASDTRWRNSWRALAQAHGLSSCWSTPVISLTGQVLGTFALYQREPGTPNLDQLELIRQFTHLASITIERARRDTALRQSEARLSETERELQLMIDTIPAFVTVFRPDGERVYVNKTWRDNTGLELADIQHGGWTRIVHPDDQERSERLWRAALATGEPLVIEQRIRRHDGEYRWHMGRRVPLRDDGGNILRWYSVAIDIEDQKRAEAALRQSEARLVEAERELQRTIDSIPTLVATYQPDGARIFVNRTWRDYSGLSFDSALKVDRLGTSIVHPDDAGRFVEAWRMSLARGAPLKLELRLRRADGAYRWHAMQRVLARDAAGAPVRWYSVAIDIEERKRAEEALRESEQNSRLVVDSIPGLIAIFTPGGEVERVNRQLLDYFGKTLEEMQHWGTSDMVHPEDRPHVLEQFTRSIASGSPFDFEVRARRSDGVYRWFQSRGLPLRDANGHIVRWYNLLIDIDERMQAEQALQQSETRLAQAEHELRLTLDSIPVITWRGAANGYVQQLNKRWFEYTGTTPEQVRGWRWKLCVHPDDLERLVEIGSAYVASGEPIDCEARLRRFDGTYRWFLFRPAPARDEAGRVVGWYGAVTDIEDHKRTEEELRRSEAFLAKGQQASLTGTFSWDPATEKYTWSEELYRIYDFEPGIPVTLEMIGTRYHPEDRQLLEEMAARGRGGGADFDYQHRLLMPDGSIKYVHVVAHGGEDKNGRALEHFGAVQDITQRRLAEQELDKTRSELAHVTRVMSLSALTASIAHEVNQPLAGIITNASTCLRMLGADPPNIEGARETARRTIRDGNRAADVIARLRALFSKKPAAAETVDLNELTREVLSLVFSDLLRNRVVLRVELDEERPLRVSGDRVQLQQVIMNLVRNASDAMSDVSDRPRTLLVRAWDEEDGARLIVKDAGVGFESHGAERLFDAFYTTKSGGMGIGLSVSRSIIENHGGRLWAEPNDGPGATFSFSIPRQTTSAGDDGTTSAIFTRPTRGAHDLMRNAE